MSLAISEIVQSNISDSSDVISIHNPIVYIVTCEYIGEDTPESIPVYIYSLNRTSQEYELKGTYKAMPYNDVDSTHRQFIFVANQILRGYMSSFDDYCINGDVVSYHGEMSVDFRINFINLTWGIEFTALHAVRQIGENQNLTDVYSNDAGNVYYTGVGMPVYVYYWNYDENAEINDNGDIEFLADYDGTLIEDFNSLLTSE